LEKVDKQTIAKIINTDMKIHDDINKVLSIATKNYISKEGNQPNTETRRKIEASSVAIYFIGKQDETNNSDYPIS
jgi:hypothetical protein